MDIGSIWNNLVVTPLSEALIFLFEALSSIGLPSWGLTIIVFTMLVKVVMLPLTLQQVRSTKAMQAMQPQLQALQKQYGKDREKLMQEQMRLYKENKVNPAAGCLPMLLQMPIWIGLYNALFGLSHQGLLNEAFLWLPSLAEPEPASLSWPPAIPLLALSSGASMWLVQKMTSPPSTDSQQKMMQQVMQFMPLMFVFIAFQVPSGLVLYWVSSNIFMLVQQYFTTGLAPLFPARAEANTNDGRVALASVSKRLPATKSPELVEAQTGTIKSEEMANNGRIQEPDVFKQTKPQTSRSGRRRRRRR